VCLNVEIQSSYAKSTAWKSKSGKYTPTQLVITDIMSQMLSAFIALSLFVLSVDFHHYWLGGGF